MANKYVATNINQVYDMAHALEWFKEKHNGAYNTLEEDFWSSTAPDYMYGDYNCDCQTVLEHLCKGHSDFSYISVGYRKDAIVHFWTDGDCYEDEAGNFVGVDLSKTTIYYDDGKKYVVPNNVKTPVEEIIKEANNG